MMRFSTVGFLICQITVLSQAEKFGAHFPPENTKRHVEDLAATPARYRSDEDYPERNFPNYSQIARREFDLPVSIKAPHHEAHDYWQNKHDYYDRGIFFQRFSYGPHDKTTPFPDFYQFKTSVFAGKDDITPELPPRFYYSRNRVTPPNSFDVPFGYGPTEPNYIPPPKPIRASVIKLETITSSPIHPSVEHETSKKYFPHVETILKQALIENSNAKRNLRLHPQEPLKIPPFKPLPVLPKPRHASQTTLTPIHPEFFNSQTPHKYFNETDYKYPESVQDQLPHLSQDEIKIPYVSEKSIPQIFNTLSTESPAKRHFGYSEDYFPDLNSNSTTDTFGLIDVRSFTPFGINTERTETPNGDLSGVKFKFDTTTTKSFPGAVEKIKRPTFKYIKKLTAQLDKSSIERVANLTVQGFSKMKNENVNSRSHFNHFKVNNLIKHELGTSENISRSALGTEQTHDSSTRLVNLNDELSLDAKILKDTNWDGLTSPPAATTTEESKETTALRTTQHKKNNTAFWEVVQDQNTTPSTTSEKAAAEATTTTAQGKPQTSPEFTTLGPSTPDATETSDFFTTKEITTRGEFQERPEKDVSEKSFKIVTENPDTFDATNTPDGAISRKKYSRRPKTVNFTPYPTVEELQKKLANRNPFPKRQKPNITLAFGNKNVLKNRQDLEKDEVMKFSDEDIRKRRKTGKRRQVFKRIRMPSTSERPVQNDYL